ncbi:MAG: hypothetical protein RL571_2900 [Pseudomonadota bacterium]|jgi:hypothetical protein
MFEEKMVVDILSDTSEELKIKGNNGVEYVYYPPLFRTMYVRVVTIQHVYSQSDCNITSIYGESENKGELSELSCYLAGVVELEDLSIALMGDPDSSTRRLSLILRPIDNNFDKSKKFMALEADQSVSTSHVFLGFNRRDWEIGNTDEWYLECYLPKASFDAISAAISSKTLSSMNIGIKLKNIYIDCCSWEPVSESANWFLRPNKEDGTIDQPESAYGEVSGLNFRLLNMSLSNKIEIDYLGKLDEPDINPIPDLDRRLEALIFYFSRLERILKWIGGAIALCFILITFKYVF